MRLLTFKQGIHPEYNKELSRDKPLRKTQRPSVVMIPLKHHIGAPCKALVEKGEHVKLGQKIADSDSFVSAPVHASVSGVVKDIKKMPSPPTGNESEVIIIEADEKDLSEDGFKKSGELNSFNADELREIIHEAGIVGLGGAMFPTHVKLSIPEEKEVEYFILNGAECEPYLTVDHRLMLEHSEDIIFGLRALMKVTGTAKGIIGIEENKLEAVEVMKKEVEGIDNIEIAVLETKYPQGGEKMLIKALLNREVPEGGLPLDVGVVVNNISTAVAVSNAVKKGKVLYESAMTVTGPGVKEPSNLIYRIGTPIKDLIEEAGGYTGEVSKIIMGGPMTGFAQPSDDVPAVKGTSGILVFTKEEVQENEVLPCIKCARCIDSCPQRLLPVKLAFFAEHEMYEKLEDYHVENCIECGSCSYICPSKRPLVQHIKLGKAEVIARKREG